VALEAGRRISRANKLQDETAKILPMGIGKLSLMAMAWARIVGHTPGTWRLRSPVDSQDTASIMQEPSRRRAAPVGITVKFQIDLKLVMASLTLRGRIPG
jgi:hypothetical protein